MGTRHSEGIEGQAGFWQTSLLVRAAGFVTSTNCQCMLMERDFFQLVVWGELGSKHRLS